MAGILANSASVTMVSGQESADNSVTGFVISEQITLSVIHAGATSWQWATAIPAGSSTAKSALTSTSSAASSLIPDTTGVFTITCMVNDATEIPTSYTLRADVTAVASSVPVNALHHLSFADSQIATPASGAVVYHSKTRDKLVQKDSTGIISDVGGSGGGPTFASLPDFRAAAATQFMDKSPVTILSPPLSLVWSASTGAGFPDDNTTCFKLTETLLAANGRAYPTTPHAVVPTMAALAAISVPDSCATPQITHVVVQGYSERGGVGGGEFDWNDTNAGASNGGTIVTPTGRTVAGRWLRKYNGREINVEWFGAKHDQVTNDTAAILSALAYAWQDADANRRAAMLYFPAGFYLCDAVLLRQTGWTGAVIRGDLGLGFYSVGAGTVYPATILQFSGTDAVNSGEAFVRTRGFTNTIWQNITFDGFQQPVHVFEQISDQDWGGHGASGNLFQCCVFRGARGHQWTNTTVDYSHIGGTSTASIDASIRTPPGNCHVKISFPVGGTVGTPGITYQISYNNGQSNHEGGPYPLGTATRLDLWTTSDGPGVRVNLDSGQTIGADGYITFVTDGVGVPFVMGQFGRSLQCDQTTFRHCSFWGVSDATGVYHSTYAAFQQRAGGNTKNYRFDTCGFSQAIIGFDGRWSTGGGFLRFTTCTGNGTYVIPSWLSSVQPTWIATGYNPTSVTDSETEYTGSEWILFDSIGHLRVSGGLYFVSTRSDGRLARVYQASFDQTYLEAWNSGNATIKASVEVRAGAGSSFISHGSQYSGHEDGEFVNVWSVDAEHPLAGPGLTSFGASELTHIESHGDLGSSILTGRLGVQTNLSSYTGWPAIEGPEYRQAWTPGAIASGSCATTTITPYMLAQAATGQGLAAEPAPGDLCEVSYDQPLAAGLMLTAGVGATDGSGHRVVNITLANFSGSPITPANGNLRLTIKPTGLASRGLVVTPVTGPVSGGTDLTITRTDLAGVTAVYVGGVECTNLVQVSPTEVTCTTANMSTFGAKDVQIIGPVDAPILYSGFFAWNAQGEWGTSASINDPALGVTLDVDGHSVLSWVDQRAAGSRTTFTPKSGATPAQWNAASGPDLAYIEGGDTDHRMVTGAIAALSQPWTAIVVAQVVPTSTTPRYWFDGGLPGNTGALWSDVVTGDSAALTINAGSGLGAAVAHDLSQKHVYAVVFDGANSRVEQDGALLFSGNAGATAAGQLVLFGALSNAAYGYIRLFDAVWVMGATTAAARLRAQRAYGVKHGITVA